MFKSLRNNPILAQQMRQARWPSLRTAVWIAAGLTVIGTCLAVISFVLSPDGSSNLALVGPSLLYLADSMLGMWGPLIAVVVVVIATVQAIDSHAFQMVRLSNLLEGDIISGYIAAAAYRLRILWMLAGGLLIPLWISTTHGSVIGTIEAACEIPFASSHSCILPRPADILLPEAGYAFVHTLCDLVLFVAWHWFACTLGVWMAFRHRHIGKTLVGALIWLAIAVGLQIGIMSVILGLVESTASKAFYSFGIRKWSLTGMVLVFAVIFLALGKVNFNRAVSQIERAPK